MEGELVILSPTRPSCVSSKSDGLGFGSPTLTSLMDSPLSCVSDGRGDGSGSVFSPTTRAPWLETKLKSPSPCISDRRFGGDRSAFRLLTRASPLPNSPSSCVSDSGRGNSSSICVSKERERGVQEAEGLLRAMTELYNDCFLRLRDATAEIVALRRECLRLTAENLQLSLLLAELGTEQSKQAAVVALTPPKPVQAESALGCAPKSISIRSKGFLSQQQQQQPPPPRGESKPQRLRVRASLAAEEAWQKEMFDEQVEVEAYHQGSLKTELCNKWERGACPYAGRCRFAHGLQELRPVIRHPRYKTLPCQMFSAPSGCPYGHRCHFRHSLPPTAESS